MSENVFSPDLDKIFSDFVDDYGRVMRGFYKHFGEKRANFMLPVPIIGAVEKGIVYDDDHNIDLRMLMSLVHPSDRKLFVDIATHVSDYFKDRPASDTTLRQFKAMLMWCLHKTDFGIIPKLDDSRIIKTS